MKSGTLVFGETVIFGLEIVSKNAVQAVDKPLALRTLLPSTLEKASGEPNIILQAQVVGASPKRPPNALFFCLFIYLTSSIRTFLCKETLERPSVTREIPELTISLAFSSTDAAIVCRRVFRWIKELQQSFVYRLQQRQVETKKDLLYDRYISSKA